MALSWSIGAKTVNGEGSQIVLAVTVTTDDPSNDFGASLDVNGMNDNAKDELLAHPGAITGWRFDSTTGALASSGGTSLIDDAGVSDVTGPSPFGMSGEIVTFNYRITLADDGLIALNNSSVTLALPNSGWLKLRFKTPVLWHDAVAFSTLTITPTAAGRLPSGHLKLHADTQAQWVKNGGGSSPLNTWNDITGAYDLSAGGSSKPNLTGGAVGVPALTFPGGADPGRYSNASPPVIQSAATIAVVAKPNTAAATAMLVGRYNGLAGTNLSWRVYYKGDTGTKQVVYQSRSTSAVTNAFDLLADDSTFLFVARRDNSGSDNLEAWVNGRSYPLATAQTGINAGTGPVYVGARESGVFPVAWTDPFIGDIDQVALYDIDMDDLALSLVMHQMARRAVVVLGSPIPTAWQTQPNLNPASNARQLDRRPIAVIQLSGGNHNTNMFGQAAAWRDAPDNSGEADYNALKASICAAFYGCDDFEIMFNRPGGAYSEDLPMSYPFETYDPSGAAIQVITSQMWTTLRDLWTYFNLASDSVDNQIKNSNHYPQRRGWIYTGSGLPLKDDGTLETSGLLSKRQVAPATPVIYKTTILDKWSASGQTYGDPRFRCFFIDNSSSDGFRCKLVEMVHDSAVNNNTTGYILVGEAIPQDDTASEWASHRAARLGAPWFGMSATPRGPWWNKAANGGHDKRQGYNPEWSADWVITPMPVYFGVQYSSGELLNLYITTTDPGGPGPGSSNDMKLGYIYKWILNGGLPVSWSPETHAKVGMAWNYATGRIVPSRHVRCPRLRRSARC